MRIILTTHAFYPDAIGGGGVARYADTIARELRARGHEVALLTASSTVSGDAPGARFEDDDWQGLPVRRLSFNLSLAPHPYRFRWDNPWVNECLLEFVQERRAEVVHFVHAGHLSLSCVPLLKRQGLALFASVLDYWFICAVSNLRRADGSLCQGPDLLGGECLRCVAAQHAAHDRLAALVRRVPNLALKGLGLAGRVLPSGQGGRLATVQAQGQRPGDMRRFLAQMDAVLCPSLFVARLLQRNGFAVANLQLLPLGVPALPRPERPPEQAGPLRVGFLGRLEPAKGPHVLVEAVRRLPADLPLEARIHGYEEAPRYVQRLREHAAADPRIQVPGAAASAAEAMGAMDVVVVPSLVYEVFPLVIREAQMLGLPVLASDIGGMREAVRDGVDGLLFRAGDAESLARQIRRLVEEPGLLERLRTNVPRPMATGEHVDALVDLYQRCLEARSPGASGPIASGRARR